MPLDEALQERAEDCRQRPPAYGQRPQAAVEGPESAVGKTAAPRMDAESGPLQPSLTLPPCGYFVSAQHEADCARFLAETKRLARRRAEAALGRPSAAY